MAESECKAAYAGGVEAADAEARPSAEGGLRDRAATARALGGIWRVLGRLRRMIKDGIEVLHVWGMGKESGDGVEAGTELQVSLGGISARQRGHWQAESRAFRHAKAQTADGEQARARLWARGRDCAISELWRQGRRAAARDRRARHVILQVGKRSFIPELEREGRNACSDQSRNAMRTADAEIM